MKTKYVQWRGHYGYRATEEVNKTLRSKELGWGERNAARSAPQWASQRVGLATRMAWMSSALAPALSNRGSMCFDR